MNLKKYIQNKWDEYYCNFLMKYPYKIGITHHLINSLKVKSYFVINIIEYI
jgi:hypothetical protein